MRRESMENVEKERKRAESSRRLRASTETLVKLSRELEGQKYEIRGEF